MKNSAHAFRLYASAESAYGTTARRAAMARSRRLLGRRVVMGAGLVLGVLLLATGQVALSNGILSQRCRLAVLEADRDYYQAKVGGLESQWNRATSRDLIVARAGVELGLVQLGEPAPVLVHTAPESLGRPEAWRGWLAGLGGGTEARAATGRGEP